jgi:GH25 family lysozyme M1 (1,4-beta-N-acetylmuramidase)
VSVLSRTTVLLAAAATVATSFAVTGAPAADAAGTGSVPISARHPERDWMGSQVVRHVHASGSAATARPGVVQTPGLDVSGWQGTVDWTSVAAHGAKFTYVKATEGTYYQNPYFGQQYTGSYAAGLTHGAYHFATPDTSSGTAQADYFVAHGGGWSGDGRTLPGMLDIEWDPYGSMCYGLSQSAMTQWILAFSNEYHAKTTRWPMIYTARTWWSTCVGTTGNFSSTNPLALACYCSSPGTMPYAWPVQTIWQWADHGTFPGDQDMFNGDVNRLRALAAPYPLNPAANIPLPGYVRTGACLTAPAGPTCTALFVRALDAARAASGQPNYALPYRFAYLTGIERLLVLVNQDRALYARVPVSGLNQALDAAAGDGVANDRDPSYVNPVDGHAMHGGGANWGVGSGLMANSLDAYYLWMYDDGPGSGNIHCAQPGDPGCWGHRDATLRGFGAQYKVLLGASGGAGRRHPYAWAELLEAFDQDATIPLVPTVQGTNVHTGRPGTSMLINGFGLYHASRVLIVGRAATVTERHITSLRVTIPAGTGSGWVVVYTDGGASNRTWAAAFGY